MSTSGAHAHSGKRNIARFAAICSAHGGPGRHVPLDDDGLTDQRRINHPFPDVRENDPIGLGDDRGATEAGAVLKLNDQHGSFNAEHPPNR